MNTQIAVAIDPKRKTSFLQNLKKQGLTSKAFITFCIDAFNNGKLSLWVVTQYNPDTYLTQWEEIALTNAMVRFAKGEYDDFDTVMRQIWHIK